MRFSGLDLSVWIAIYLGICLIRSSLPLPRTEACASGEAKRRSAFARSANEGKRALRFFSKQRKITLSSPAGTSERTAVIGVAGSATIEARSPGTVGAIKAGKPLNN